MGMGHIKMVSSPKSSEWERDSKFCRDKGQGQRSGTIGRCDLLDIGIEGTKVQGSHLTRSAGPVVTPTRPHVEVLGTW